MTTETPPLTPPPAPLEPPKNTRPHLSFSQIDKYRRCSLQWYLKYIEKWPDRPSLNLSRGKAGHHAVEIDHRNKIDTGLNVPKEKLLDEFSDAYDGYTYALTPADLRPGEDIGKAKDMTAATLTYYHAKVGPKMQPRLVEWEFNLDLPPTEEYEYPIKIVNGRIDVLDATGIFDNKFPARRALPNQEKVDSSWQLTLYDLAFKTELNLDVPNLGLISFLPPNTREGAEVKTVRRSLSELEPEARERRRDRLVHVLRTTQRAMDLGIYMPTDDPMTCSFCDFRDRCQSSLAKDDWRAIEIQQHKGAA